MQLHGKRLRKDISAGRKAAREGRRCDEIWCWNLRNLRSSRSFSDLRVARLHNQGKRRGVASTMPSQLCNNLSVPGLPQQ